MNRNKIVNLIQLHNKQLLTKDKEILQLRQELQGLRTEFDAYVITTNARLSSLESASNN